MAIFNSYVSLPEGKHDMFCLSKPFNVVLSTSLPSSLGFVVFLKFALNFVPLAR
jgi:hypothetical protein